MSFTRRKLNDGRCAGLRSGKTKPWTRNLIGKPQDKRQSYSEPSHVLAAETPDLVSYPFASHGDGFIGYHLRFAPQSIFGLRLDGNAKIRSVHQFGSQLANHHRGMVLREGVGLHDDRWTRFAIITGRGNSHQITASHLHQTRTRRFDPFQRVAARNPGRGWRPVSPLVVALPASGDRQRQGAARADPVRGAAAASSSSSPPLPLWALQVQRQRRGRGSCWLFTVVEQSIVSKRHEFAKRSQFIIVFLSVDGRGCG